MGLSYTATNITKQQNSQTRLITTLEWVKRKDEKYIGKETLMGLKLQGFQVIPNHSLVSLKIN